MLFPGLCVLRQSGFCTCLLSQPPCESRPMRCAGQLPPKAPKGAHPMSRLVLYKLHTTRVDNDTKTDRKLWLFHQNDARSETACATVRPGIFRQKNNQGYVQCGMGMEWAQNENRMDMLVLSQSMAIFGRKRFESNLHPSSSCKTGCLSCNLPESSRLHSSCCLEYRIHCELQ